MGVLKNNVNFENSPEPSLLIYTNEYSFKHEYYPVSMQRVIVYMSQFMRFGCLSYICEQQMLRPAFVLLQPLQSIYTK